MSGSESSIRCRECKETIDADAGSCPHCGTSIRSDASLAAIVAVGGIIAVGSLFDVGSLWFFGVIGLLVAAVGTALLYEKRQRLTAGSAGRVDSGGTEDGLFE